MVFKSSEKSELMTSLDFNRFLSSVICHILYCDNHQSLSTPEGTLKETLFPTLTASGGSSLYRLFWFCQVRRCTHCPERAWSQRSCTAPVRCSERHSSSTAPRTDPQLWWWRRPRTTTASTGARRWWRWCRSSRPVPGSNPTAGDLSWPSCLTLSSSPVYFASLPPCFTCSSFCPGGFSLSQWINLVTSLCSSLSGLSEHLLLPLCFNSHL